MRLAVALALAGMACGGNSTTTPTGGTIKITSTGVSPSSVSIGAGGSVTFVNQDTASHSITSPCPELISGTLTTNQQFTATITGAKTCSFSDALNPGAAQFTGTVTVVAPGPGH